MGEVITLRRDFRGGSWLQTMTIIGWRERTVGEVCGTVMAFDSHPGAPRSHWRRPGTNQETLAVTLFADSYLVFLELTDLSGTRNSFFLEHWRALVSKLGFCQVTTAAGERNGDNYSQEESCK
jgi:hypothetical protein